MIERISVKESKPYQKLIKVCDTHKIDKDKVNKLLWAINAEPDLTGFIRVIYNLKSIIKEVHHHQNLITSEEADEFLLEINQLLNISNILKEVCGNQLDISPKKKSNNKSYHPFNHLCLTRHPIYSMLWNKAWVDSLKNRLIKEDLREKEIIDITIKFEQQFQILQWHLFSAHHDLIKSKVPIGKYLNHNSDENLLGPYHPTIYDACQSAREYCQPRNYKKLPRLKVERISSEFFTSMHLSESYELDKLASPFKTLGRKIDENQGLLRIELADRKKRRRSGQRRKSTSYLAEDFQNVFDPTDHDSKKSTLEKEPKLRTLKSWGIIEGWKESDLDIEEQEDEEFDSIFAETECKARRSQKDQIMAAIGLANKRAVLNQHLPIHYNLMTIAEIASAMRTLGDIFKDDKMNIKSKKVAALGIFMYWTGSTVKRMQGLVVVPPGKDIGDSAELAYFIEKKMWCIKVPIYNAKKTTTEEQELLCRPNGEFLYLQDFWECDIFLRKIIDNKDLNSKELMYPFKKHKVKTYESVLKDIFQDHNNSGLRINHHYLARDLSLRLLSSGDSVEAMMLTGSTNFPSNTQRHYTTPSFEHLTKVYRKLVIPLIKKIRVEKYSDRENIVPLPETIKTTSNIGSGAENCPTINEVKNVFNRIIYEIEHSSNQSDYHKYYTIYVTFMICYFTGYRAVRDINLESKLRDPETEFAWISDKDNKDGYHTRRVFLSALLEEQLKQYEAYRKIILSTWEIQFPKVILPNKAELPYLFLINEKNKIIPVSPSSMIKPLEELNYPLPLNSNRRFLRTELVERGCPIDVLNTFMGHWSNGQEPHNPYSCLSPRQQKVQLKKYLLPLLDEIGLKVIHHKWTNINGYKSTLPRRY